MKRTQGLCTLVPASWSTCYPEILAGSFWGCLQPQSGLLSKVPTWLPGTRCSYEPASHSVQILLVSSWEELSLPDSCPVIFFLASSHFFIVPLPNCSRPWLRIFSFLGFLLLKAKSYLLFLSAQYCLFSDFATSVYTDFKGKSYSSALKMFSQWTLWLSGFSDLQTHMALYLQRKRLKFYHRSWNTYGYENKMCERKFMWWIYIA